ncbi:hypothetical protein BGX38DRAFT_1220195 [Terfezia claveryi]|nr:hypothetical protein BGX38DRAFT_1220195 [Terfezia claveryi]
MSFLHKQVHIYKPAMRAPLPYLLPTSVISRLAGICGLKHACADLSHQRAPICLPANHTYLSAASTETYFQACVNEHNTRARAPPLCTGNSTSQSAAGQAEVRTPPVHSRDIPHLYAET